MSLYHELVALVQRIEPAATHQRVQEIIAGCGTAAARALEQGNTRLAEALVIVQSQLPRWVYVWRLDGTVAVAVSDTEANARQLLLGSGDGLNYFARGDLSERPESVSSVFDDFAYTDEYVEP